VTDETFKMLECVADPNDIRYGSSHRLSIRPRRVEEDHRASDGGIEMTQNSGEKQPRLISDSKFGTDLPDTICGEVSRRERHAPVRSRAQDSA
jgi:hypothetical protein